MKGRTRTWLRDLADLATISQLLGSGSIAGLLALAGQEGLNTLLGLSPVVRVLFGICIFFLALGVIFAVLKTFLERHSQGKVLQDPLPQSSEYSLLQELKRVESEKEQLRASLQQYEQEVEQLRDWIDKIEPFKRHLQLRFVLRAIHRMGNNLHEAQRPDTAAMEKWMSLTSALIRRTLDDDTANFFLFHDGDSSFAGRLQRLEHIFGNQALEMTIKIPSDFDVAEAIEPYPIEWSNKYGV